MLVVVSTLSRGVLKLILYLRAFALPDGVDRERIEARLEDGVLTLTLPKAAEAKPRRIALA